MKDFLKEDTNINDKLKFLKEYCGAENAATGSKYDANANVDYKNITTLMGELPKKEFIKLNRKMLYDKITELYGQELADRYISMLNNHFIYKNDETSLANYCASITMYPWLLEGTIPIGGHAKAPTNLKSFCGGFINLVFMVSSMLSGACATPEFLMYMNYFIEKEYGEDYYKESDKVVDLSKKHRTIKKVITDCFEQVVYSINQPTGARNFQAVFWNISYYDKYYFESLFGEFVFPDGSKPNWDSLNWLQKQFMMWFNAERTKIPITFPVETMALLSKDGDAKDKEYGDFTAKMYAEGHSFFTYLSNNADSLSSCCFSGDTMTLSKSANGVNFATFKELYEAKWEDDKKNFTIFHNGSWSSGRLVRLDNRPMYKITTANNKEIIVSDNHLNVTQRGDVSTTDITTDDFLMFNTNQLNSVKEKDNKLTYEMGFAVGAFLGDGSFGSTRHLKNGDDRIYEVVYSLSDDKKGVIDVINDANIQLGGVNHCYLSKKVNNCLLCGISSMELIRFIKTWTNWQKGTSASTKEINMNCLLQSADFRLGILDGWYETDGGNSNRCYTSSKKLAHCMEAVATSLGMSSVINISDRTDEKVIIRGSEYSRNHPLYCVRFYEPHNKRSMEGVYIVRNNSIFFKVVKIEKVEYSDYIYCFEMKNQQEPYFTLPNGIITHNCRLRNEIQDNGFSYTLGAGGVSTGSKSVLTINLNRCIQKGMAMDGDYLPFLEKMVDLCHKVQIAYNENLKYFQERGMLPLFSQGYINLSRQYLTIGVNGLVEGAEFLGIKINDNPEYLYYVQEVLGLIETYNKKYRTKENMFNCEMIPAENVGVKHAKWDKEDGYEVPRDCYNSYFYPVEDKSLNILDHFKLHGFKYIEHLTGGSALHLNLEEHLSEAQYRQLIRVAAKEGCNYFTYNIPNTICNKCGYIDKRYLKECPHCHSRNVDYLTRVIGYMKRVSSFSKARQIEERKRAYIKD